MDRSNTHFIVLMIKELIPTPFSWQEKGYILQPNNYCQTQFPSPHRRGELG